MLKIFKYLLYPISILYGGIVWIRNWLYDKKVMRSASFDFPVICVGNLVVGGSGKSPMIEYLIGFLKTRYRIATLSRGYGRKTSGFLIAEPGVKARDLGDEPLQFYIKFPDILVAVMEDRILGIPAILDFDPGIEVILLDDAFQHREIRAGLNLLLTEYGNLYTRDHLLPVGRLRDVRSSRKRAEMIIVTKCPENLDQDFSSRVRESLRLTAGQQVFFTKLAYECPYHLFSQEKRELNGGDTVLLVTGIANPGPMMSHITPKVEKVIARVFSDHHEFTERDVEEIKSWITSKDGKEKIVLTTEKDATRLKDYESLLGNLPIYALPVQHEFLFNEEAKFQGEVLRFIRKFTSKS